MLMGTKITNGANRFRIIGNGCYSLTTLPQLPCNHNDLSQGSRVPIKAPSLTLPPAIHPAVWNSLHHHVVLPSAPRVELSPLPSAIAAYPTSLDPHPSASKHRRLTRGSTPHRTALVDSSSAIVPVRQRRRCNSTTSYATA